MSDNFFFKVFEMVSGKYLNSFRETVISPKELIRCVAGTQLVSHLHTHWHALWNKDAHLCTYMYRQGHYCVYSVDLVAEALPPFGFITMHLTKSLAPKLTETMYALRALLTCIKKRNWHNLHIEFLALLLQFFFFAILPASFVRGIHVKTNVLSSSGS